MPGSLTVMELCRCAPADSARAEQSVAVAVMRLRDLTEKNTFNFQRASEVICNEQERENNEDFPFSSRFPLMCATFWRILWQRDPEK